MTINMSMTKRITANLPASLLKDALESTGKGITDTLVEGLNLLKRRKAYKKGMALKGRLKLDINVDELRERPDR